MKQIIVGNEARQKAVDALSFIANAVGTTLGPKGLSFIMEKNNSLDGNLSPVISKDGISVMKSFDFTDPIQHAVHNFCVQASSHTVYKAGDGPLPEYYQVLTPNGFVELKNVYVGMEICGTNGTIQKILGVFHIGEKEIYEVEFSNKRIVECCEDHLWTVTNTGLWRCPLETKTTKELQKDYVTVQKNNSKFHRYYTPRTVVEFANNERDMPLDPYLVGVLLGDGSLTGSGSIEMSLGIKKEHIIEKLKLPEGFSLTTTFIPSKNAFRVKIKGKNNEDKTIQAVVDSIGLLGTNSKTKFIPKAYLYSSLENRTKLLQGITDTDGCVDKNGRVRFSSTSKRLADDVVDLCRSLGKTVNITKHDRKEDDGSYSMTSIYIVYVTKGPKYGNKIERITSTGKMTPMMCIKVSNSDNLYITDNFIATHNTTSTVVLAAEIAKGILKAAPERPQAFARIIQLQSNRAIAEISKESDKSPELAEMVALTSSNGDTEMVEWVMKAVKDNPVFGSIIIERSPAEQERYRLIKQDGLTGGRGYNQHLQFAHSFSEKPAENSPFEVESPYVLLYDGDLISSTQIIPVINALALQLKSPWSLVVVAYEIGQEVANVLAEVNLRQKANGIKIWASSIRLTAEVNSGWHKLQDISSFTGATIINHSNVDSVTRYYLGNCSKVQVTPEKSIFMGRSPNHWIPKRAMQNENGIENATTELDKERIKERNAELVSGLVKLVVGGGHMAGIGERADRCDDAIKAAQACFRSGALPGCGAAYIRAAELAEVGTELKTAFACIHNQIMNNFGTAPIEKFEKNQTAAITENGAVLTGDFRQLKVADSYDTVAAVIKNATELGILFSTLGGYSLTSDLHEIEQIQRVKSMMG